MKTFVWSFNILIMGFMLSSCGASDVASDLGSCQVDFYKIIKQFTKEQEQDFRYSCMRSKGYAYASDDFICKGMAPSGIVVESCFTMPSPLNSIKRLLAK